MYEIVLTTVWFCCIVLYIACELLLRLRAKLKLFYTLHIVFYLGFLFF